MRPDELDQCLQRFSRGSIPGRNLYLWCGSCDSLRKLLQKHETEEASAIDLPGLEPRGSGEETASALETAISNWLLEVTSRHPQRSIAVLHDVELLARYRVGLGRVYQLHASDRRLTILCAPTLHAPTFHLPDGIRFDGRAASRYFRALLPPQAIVEEVGHAPDAR